MAPKAAVKEQDTTTGGIVAECTCKENGYKGEGHENDCPARQPGDPHPCVCATVSPAWKGEGHSPECPAHTLTKGVEAAK